MRRNIAWVAGLKSLRVARLGTAEQPVILAAGLVCYNRRQLHHSYNRYRLSGPVREAGC